MTRPPFLQKGDTVYLINIARKGVYDAEFVTSTFESWGLQTMAGETISDGGYCQFSADRDTRLRELQSALNDVHIKGIFFLRGGYGTVQLLDDLDFSTFKKHPKWLIGFSDITYLHAHLNRNVQVETIHGAMLFGWKTAAKSDLVSLRELLFGTNSSFSFENLENHKIANVQGELIGGNLSILHTVIGTASDIDCDGKILVIEDTYENLMSIERMLYAMKRSGKFNKLKALLVGDFIIPLIDNETSNCMVAQIPQPNESNIEAAFRLMLLQFFKEYDFPVCFGLNVGHRADRNTAVHFGRQVALEMASDHLTMHYQ